MSTIAIYVLGFMIVASLLGFFVAWAWKQPAVDELTSTLEGKQKDFQQLQTQHDALQEHAKKVEKEKEKLVYENERLTLKLSMLLGKSKAMKEQKELLETDGFIDTSSLDQKINDLNAQINKLNEEIDIVKKESLEWQVQYTEILKEKEELSEMLSKLRNPRT